MILLWSGIAISALITSGNSWATNSRAIPGNVASGSSFRLTQACSRPPTFEMVVLFVFYVDVRNLSSGAFETRPCL
jgi:hypothetical protein